MQVISYSSKIVFLKTGILKIFFNGRSSNKLMSQVLNRDSHVHSNRYAKIIGDKENPDCIQRIFGNLINDVQDTYENIKSLSEKP